MALVMAPFAAMDKALVIASSADTAMAVGVGTAMAPSVLEMVMETAMEMGTEVEIQSVSIFHGAH
jgi:hypothetical protein